jgi:hypothetical protein
MFSCRENGKKEKKGREKKANLLFGWRELKKIRNKRELYMGPILESYFPSLPNTS